VPEAERYEIFYYAGMKEIFMKSFFSVSPAIHYSKADTLPQKPCSSSNRDARDVTSTLLLETVKNEV
jgi:hypothetical protein